MGNPNRRPTVSSKSPEQKCLHRHGNSCGWTYSDLHIQQEYAAWIQTPFKKRQACNGGNIVVQQQISRTDEPLDWADEVLAAAQSSWEQDWDGNGWGKKVEEKGGACIGGGESPLKFPAQSTVILSDSLKKEEAGNGERQSDGAGLWDPMGAGAAGSGMYLKQDEGAGIGFNGGMKNIPEEVVSRNTAASG